MHEVRATGAALTLAVDFFHGLLLCAMVESLDQNACTVDTSSARRSFLSNSDPSARLAPDIIYKLNNSACCGSCVVRVAARELGGRRCRRRQEL